MCSKICFALLLVASLHTANGQFFSNLVSSFSSSIQNAFGGNRAPVPPGTFLPPAQAPVPQYALSPAAGSPYLDIKALLQNSSGPIVYKTAQAAAFLFPEALSDRTLASRSQTVPLSNNTGSLFAAYVNSTLILAFNSTNDVYATLFTASNSSSQEPSFLKPYINGSRALSRALQPLEDLLGGNATISLDAIIANVSSGANPARILTTGFGAGGALAQLTAVWASVTWTDTLLRCVTFGTPPVMNNKAAFMFQQFVDLPYIWAYNGSSLVNTVLRTIDNNTNPTTDGRYSMGDYAQAIINAGAHARSNGTRVPNPGISYEVANSNAAIPSTKGLFGAVPGTLKEVSGTAAAPTPVSEFANQTVIQTLLAAPAPKSSPSCPPILCKIRAPAEAACGNYEVFPPGGPGFSPLLRTFPSAQEVATQPYDTHVIINWDADQRTAFFVFRGSITRQDWLQDAKLKLTDGNYLLSPQVRAIFPGIETHYGFSEQFREVTDRAANNSVNIGAILRQKMNNVPPEIVICAGHSLGAALGSLCSIWASIQYPGADILSVTLGQPYTGNQVYVDAYRLLVGREYRIVHQNDIVPSIPPLSDYRHVGLGIWEVGNQVLMYDRPPKRLDDLNWDDHACYSYSIKLQRAPNVTIFANATAETYLPTSRRSG